MPDEVGHDELGARSSDGVHDPPVRSSRPGRGAGGSATSTGFMGEPVDWMWRDQESFSDIFTGYWTDREA